MTYSDTSVIVPTLNEERNIGELLDLIGKCRGIKIIVADDGSRDGTQGIVNDHSKHDKGISLLDRSTKTVKGLTASVMDAAMQAKTRYIVVIDGDLQHPPEKIGDIVELLRGGQSIVIGTRRKVVSDWAWHRKLISLLATNLARVRLMRNIKDPVSGFFGARTDLFQGVVERSGSKFEPKGYKVLFDLMKYSPRSVRIGIVMYDFGLRKGGESKINSNHIRIFFRSLFK